MKEDNNKKLNKNSPYGFLYEMIDSKTKIEISFKENNEKLIGYIIGFDNYNVLFKIENGKRALISKHSIINIVEL